jgi:DtxR family Mn-dependent transcriptional regulator
MEPDAKDTVIQSLRTEAVEDFLKTVYKLQKQHDPVPTSLLAAELHIKPPSVTEMAKKLDEHHLIDYARYRGIRLTDRGRRIALEVIRHHRLIEMYLAEALGYSWDEVHEEADRLEHVISEQFEARIAAVLGNPNHDPHGDPIPALDGTLPAVRNVISLAEIRLNTPGTICQITDQTPDMLRYLAALGLIPGALVPVQSRDPFEGPLHLTIEETPAVISHQVAARVLLAPSRRPISE